MMVAVSTARFRGALTGPQRFVRICSLNLRSSQKQKARARGLGEPCSN